MEKKNSKKELKYVLSSDLFDELRFVFRPDTLENIIYKPDVLGERKWQCSCGSENELDVCPICGMEKNTAFSKINANYLSRHRKARIAKKKRAMQDQQAMMASQMAKKNKKQKNDKSKKLGTIIGIACVCVAIIICAMILINGEKPKPPVNSPDTTIEEQTTSAPDITETTVDTEATVPEETTSTPETVDSPETTVSPEETTVPVETTAPVENVILPVSITDGFVATVADGAWPSGASGNTSVGGLVFSGTDYDYIAKDGITVLDKDGNTVKTLTSENVTGITGNDKYIFYIDGSGSIHRYDLSSGENVTFEINAKTVCAFGDELYYVPADGKGLFAANADGQTVKTAASSEIFSLNATADKLYFSTEESLCVIFAGSDSVTSFCPDGAKATSIIEITGCIFYTGTDGKLKFYNPALSTSFGVEYPRYNVAITYVSAFENRVYIRTFDPENNAVIWYSTVWTPGNTLFAPSAFTYTGVQGNSLYVSDKAIFDGDLNRTAIS